MEIEIYTGRGWRKSEVGKSVGSLCRCKLTGKLACVANWAKSSQSPHRLPFTLTKRQLVDPTIASVTPFLSFSI